MTAFCNVPLTLRIGLGSKLAREGKEGVMQVTLFRGRRHAQLELAPPTRQWSA
jgi:hypothetical protein